MALTRGQQSILQLCNNFDIKGKLSGKRAICKNRKPVDLLGYMLEDLGYTFHSIITDGPVRSPNNQIRNPYTAAARELGFSRSASVTQIWKEIDRKNSTNASIRQKIIEVCRISEEDAAPYQPYEAPDEP